MSADSITTARALIETLQMRGVEFLFGNPGSEFVPIIEAYAELREAGRAAPRPVTVAHEAVAVHMAYGAYLASGRPQAVMVHTTVGTANASLALLNAARMNIPLLFIAGRTPITEQGRDGSRDKFIHWAQELFDQGGMVRESVKWDYELRDAAMLSPVIDRALAIAMSPPRGPVYLMLPRELLYESLPADAVSSASTVAAETATAPDPVALAALLAALAASERPLLLTKTVGTDRALVPLLESAVARHAMPVICEDAHCVNIASDHACFGGFSHAGVLGEADLLVCLDVDVPWIPARERPSDAARVFHVGDTPLFSRLPFRGHRGESMLRCDPGLFLRALREAPATGASAGSARRAWVGRLRARADDAARTGAARAGAAASEAAPGEAAAGHGLRAVDVGRAIAAVWDERCVLINELHLPPASLPVMAPGSYFRTGSASGLGWGLAVGLGIGIASAERTVIAVVGDGAFLFGNPVVVLWQSLSAKVPLLVVVLDNGGMASFRAQVREAYPDGAAVRREDYVFTDLSPALDLVALAATTGAFGQVISRPRELPDALGRAMSAVRSGRSALLHVRLVDADRAASVAPAQAGHDEDEPEIDVRLAEARGESRAFEARDAVFERGMPADGLHFVRSGNIKIVQGKPEGKETVVRIAGAGDIVGHRSIFSLQSYRASAIALEPTQTTFVRKVDVLALVAEQPRFAAALLRKLSEDLSATEQRALYFHQLNVRERVCALLLMLRGSHGVRQGDGSWRIELRLTRRELASMIAAAMENVVRVLGELRRDELIREEDNVIVVLDAERLEAMLPSLEG